jgi:hypothetical protein
MDIDPYLSINNAVEINYEMLILLCVNTVLEFKFE